MDGYRSRKWILSLIILISSIGFLAWGKLAGSDFAGICSALIVSYNFANAAEFFVAIRGAPVDPRRAAG